MLAQVYLGAHIVPCYIVSNIIHHSHTVFAASADTPGLTLYLVHSHFIVSVMWFRLHAHCHCLCPVSILCVCVCRHPLIFKRAYNSVAFFAPPPLGMGDRVNGTPLKSHSNLMGNMEYILFCFMRIRFCVFCFVCSVFIWHYVMNMCNNHHHYRRHRQTISYETIPHTWVCQLSFTITRVS